MGHLGFDFWQLLSLQFFIVVVTVVIFKPYSLKTIHPPWELI